VLLTHDVASPYHPTNQEFTTVPLEQAAVGGERHNDTLFEIRLEQGKPGQQFKSMSGQFKLVHYPTKVAMWTHTTPLPDWAFKQAEINGNKAIQQSSNVWYVDEIPSLPLDSPRLVKEAKKVKTMPFLKKYFELQRSMFYHNNALTSSHPYASQPFQWPFLLRGVSFWTQNDTKQQIYFLGNPIGYWIASCLLAVFAGIIGADQLSLRRGIDALDRRMALKIPFTSRLLTICTGTRNKLYNSTGFFFLCWAAHYLPFYLMGRQLFLHHYLPAHLASCLVTGALVEFVCNVDPVIEDDVVQERVADAKKKVPEKVKRGFNNVQYQLKGTGLYATWAVTGVIMAVVVWGWYFFLPLTYGKPGLSVEQVNARKWLNYDLHFAK
jgi:dolichyl-phosphate-mannose-protein mannosyltransferase